MIPYIVMGLGILLLIPLGMLSFVNRFPSHELVPDQLYFARGYHQDLRSREQLWQLKQLRPLPMQILLTLIILTAALYKLVYLGQNDPWAGGAVGTLMGYWFPR